MAHVFTLPKFRAFDSNGAPLVGGKVYTYNAGTTTLAATYADHSESVANTNPVILDANGEANVWIGSGSYKFVIKNADDVTFDTIDNVSHIKDGSVTTTKLDDGSVTGPKIAAGALTADTTGRSKMADGFLSADTTGRAKMADGFVNSSKIEASAVTESKIGANAVTTTKIQDEAITPLKMAFPPVGTSSPSGFWSTTSTSFVQALSATIVVQSDMRPVLILLQPVNSTSGLGASVSCRTAADLQIRRDGTVVYQMQFGTLAGSGWALNDNPPMVMLDWPSIGSKTYTLWVRTTDSAYAASVSNLLLYTVQL